MHILNSGKVLFTPLGEEGVLFHLESNEYFSSNETLTKIVLGIQNQSTKEQIIEDILNEFEIDEVSCAKSVQNAIQTLQEKDLID